MNTNAKKIAGGLMLGLSLISILSVSSTAAANNVERYYGDDRVKTSVKASEIVNSDTLILAGANSFADSLSASNIALKTGGKLILVNKNTDPTSLYKGKIDKVFIVGGKATVSPFTENMAKKFTDNIERIEGENRYSTNEKTLKRFDINNVGVADGRNYPDALSASGLLSAKNLGLKLVDGGKNYSASENVVYTFGGVNTVKQEGGKRLYGSNRYSTNEAINQELGYKENVAVASGNNFPDALSAINIVTGKNAGVVLATPNNSSKIKEYVSHSKNIFVLGGNGTLPNSYINNLLNKVSVNSNSNVVANSNAVSSNSKKTVKNYYDISNSKKAFLKKSPKTDKVNIPSGYKEVKRTTLKNGSENIYLLPDGIEYIKNEDEYIKHIADSLNNGFEENSFYLSPDFELTDELIDNSTLFLKVFGLKINKINMIDRTIIDNDYFKKIKFSYKTYYTRYTKEDMCKGYNSLQDKLNAFIGENASKLSSYNGSTPMELQEFVHDWVCGISYYGDRNDDGLHVNSLFGLFDYNTSVCGGFSFATSLINHIEGGSTVYGISKTHAWNFFEESENKWTPIDNTNYINGRVSFADSLKYGERNYSKEGFNEEDLKKSIDFLYKLREHGYKALGYNLPNYPQDLK